MSVRKRLGGLGNHDAHAAETPLSAPAVTNSARRFLLQIFTPLQQHSVLFCVVAILIGLVFYEIVYYGFPAVVSCEVQSYRFQHEARGLTAELASITSCGL